MSSQIAGHLAEIRARMADACRRARRDATEVELIAVSKTFPVEAVAEAVAAGQGLFGESKQQEAESKIAALPAGLRWHFIGHVQRNKVRKLLPAFEAIHGIDSLKLARYTNQIAGELGIRPQLFLQVNVGDEESKFGFEPEDLLEQADLLAELTHVDIVGLMTIPPATETAEQARPWFAELRELRDRLRGITAMKLPHLSMGMSGDYEVAIEEGATLVRVGSAIFGKRAYRVDGELG